jgi:PAS domain S-box-containing protein
MGAERIFGDPEQEMLGQSIFRLACVDGEKNMIAVLHQICRGERADHYETMRRRKDGTEIAVSLTFLPCGILQAKSSAHRGLHETSLPGGKGMRTPGM